MRLRTASDEISFHVEGSVTLMFVFVTIGNIISIEETYFASFLFEICDDMEIKYMVNGLEENHNNWWSKFEQYSQCKHMAMEVRFHQRQRKHWQTGKTSSGTGTRFYESIFREKNRAGNVGTSLQQPMKVDLDHAV